MLLVSQARSPLSGRKHANAVAVEIECVCVCVRVYTFVRVRCVVGMREFAFRRQMEAHRLCTRAHVRKIFTLTNHGSVRGTGLRHPLRRGRTSGIATAEKVLVTVAREVC